MGNENIYPSLEDVKQRVISAIVNLYRYDGELLEINANERSITHKLAEHLQREFPYWHVDCEYNRRGSDKKKLLKKLFNDSSDISPDDTEAITVFPDIIIHRRTIPENLMVIEVKKDNGHDAHQDIEKLRRFGRDENYSYQYGLFLRLGRDGCTEVKWFEEGIENNEEGDLLLQKIRACLEVLGYGG